MHSTAKAIISLAPSGAWPWTLLLKLASLDTPAFATPVVPVLLCEKWTFQLALLNFCIRPRFRTPASLWTDFAKPSVQHCEARLGVIRAGTNSASLLHSLNPFKPTRFDL